MPKFRAKPEVVEAEQWWPGKHVDGVVFPDPNPSNNPNMSGCSAVPTVMTIDGSHRVSPGDWIVKIVGSKTLRYVMNPTDFAAMYEAIDDAPPIADGVYSPE